MIIVIEGPDGAGKSTLAKRLQGDLAPWRGPVNIVHGGRPIGREEIFRGCRYAESLSYTHQLHILDRVRWISEIVYCDALRRPMQVSAEELSVFHDVDQVVVYLTADHYEVVQGKEHKPEEYMEKVMLNHAAICQAYEEFFDQPLPFKVIRHNRHQDSYTALLSALARRLSH